MYRDILYHAGIKYPVPLQTEGEYGMIILTKFNDEKIIVNSTQIESVELIPESKIIMMNGKFHIVRESAEEIIEKAIAYNRKSCCSLKIEEN